MRLYNSTKGDRVVNVTTEGVDEVTKQPNTVQVTIPPMSSVEVEGELVKGPVMDAYVASGDIVVEGKEAKASDADDGLDALNFKELTELAQKNNVELTSEDKSKDAVRAKLRAANVKAG